MAIPSGSGTEVLKRTSIMNLGGGQTYGDWWYTNFTSAQITARDSSATVPTNHIITILSIIICDEETSSSYPFDMGVKPSGGSIMNLVKDQYVPNKGTFTWNDKIVLSSGDALLFRVNSDSSGDDFSVYISFIDQDWS